MEEDGEISLPAEAVGFILLKSGSLFSFGLLSPKVEANAVPGVEFWREIKICPSSSSYAPSAGSLCPAAFCGERIKSYEAHAKKHLVLILEEQRKERLSGNCDLPSDLRITFYCNQKMCYSGLMVLDAAKGFSKMKYLRQHYWKLHAPKTFACSTCNKGFSTLGLLGSHMKSCGNPFECSICSKQYNTLEALQTHCRRSEHAADFSKFKDRIDIAKHEISARREADKNVRKIKKAEPIPVTVMVAKPDHHNDSKASQETWEQSVGDTDAIRSKKAETCTQTETEPGPSTSGIVKSSRSRRKRSAETQTGRKYKLSTAARETRETQTDLEEKMSPMLQSQSKEGSNMFDFDSGGRDYFTTQSGFMTNMMTSEANQSDYSFDPTMIVEEQSPQDELMMISSFATAETQTSYVEQFDFPNASEELARMLNLVNTETQTTAMFDFDFDGVDFADLDLNVVQTEFDFTTTETQTPDVLSPSEFRDVFNR